MRFQPDGSQNFGSYIRVFTVDQPQPMVRKVSDLSVRKQKSYIKKKISIYVIQTMSRSLQQKIVSCIGKYGALKAAYQACFVLYA